MAARLAVVLINAPPIAAAQRKSEQIVGELIGSPGIDLTLLGNLDLISDDSTDRLSLETLTSDVAVLSWQAPETTIADLEAIGFQGSRAKHSWDSTAESPASNQRRIYAFNLTEIPDAQQVIKALQILREDRQVRTFALNLGTTAQPPLSRSQPKSTPQGSTLSSNPKTGEALPPSTLQQTSAPSEMDLDDLIDQLDNLDP